MSFSHTGYASASFSNTIHFCLVSHLSSHLKCVSQTVCTLVLVPLGSLSLTFVSNLYLHKTRQGYNLRNNPHLDFNRIYIVNIKKGKSYDQIHIFPYSIAPPICLFSCTLFVFLSLSYKPVGS